MAAAGFYPSDDELDNWMFAEGTQSALLTFQAWEMTSQRQVRRPGARPGAFSCLCCMCCSHLDLEQLRLCLLAVSR